MQRSSVPSRGGVSWLLLCAGWSGAAIAAEVAPLVETIALPAEPPAALPAPEPEPQGAQLEEVIVTAQKREENIRDVPISVQALSGEELAARGVDSTQQLGQVVPALQFNSVAGFSIIFIRGLGTDNFIPSADPSIATYIDGIYTPNGEAMRHSFGNLERVEVLKGPQGTLFGRNATGGAINLVTATPGDELRGALNAQLGNFDSRSVSGSLSGPVTDWLSASIGGEYARKDAYYRNVNFETQPDELAALRLKLQFSLTDNLSLALTGYHSEQQGLALAINKNVQPSLIARLLGVQPQVDNYLAESDFPTSTRARQDLAYGVLDWKLPAFDLKLLASSQKQVTPEGNLDFDSSPMPLLALSTKNAFTDLRTAELQLLSNDGSWAADRFDWVAGLYYLQSSAGLDPGFFRLAPGMVSSLFALGERPGLEQLGEGLETLFDKLGLQGTPLGSDGLSLAFRGVLGTRSYSAYLQGTYRFTNWLGLTLGGRYQYEERFLKKAQTDLATPGGGTAPLLPFDLEGTDDDSFAPKAVLGLHPAPDTLVYLSYSVAYKSGTYNIVNVYKQPNYIVPEKVTAYELGAKFALLGGLLRVDSALFHNRIDNMQSGFVSILSGGVTQFVTVPRARSQGAEIGASWLPLPALDPGLTVSLNAAWLDAKYLEYPDGPGYNDGTDLYSNQLDHSGNRMVYSPRWSGTLGLSQKIPVRAGQIEVAAEQYYNSGFYTQAQNQPETWIDDYSVLNARLGYRYTPWDLGVTLYGLNLLDERYHVVAGRLDFGVSRELAAPREYGVRLDWRFGGR